MITLFYAVAAQNFLGLKGERFKCYRGFQALGKTKLLKQLIIFAGLV